MPSDLVPSGVLARELGVSRSAIVKWMRQGLIEPDLITPGGHPRWDVGRVRAALREQRKRDE
jgi:DNA-binding transcriptional MerR regulator